MMSLTEYLFDNPRQVYEPALTMLATKRIADAKKLLKKLAKLRNDASEEELVALVHRYQKVEKAIQTWMLIAEME